MVTFGQGSLRGKIFDENGEPMPGAAIVLKSQPTIGTTSDLNGLYSLKIPSSGGHIIQISMISYITVEDTIDLKKDEILIKDYSLTITSTNLKEVVVSGKQNKSRENYFMQLKALSVKTLDGINSETIRKIGDTNVSSAIARVTGVSTTSNFITVRGMGDRYIKTALNGSRIPTLDPFTNNIKLDLFPSALIDNIILVKTASPDLPGDWAGAYISVETKDYPEKLSINIETSIGYNVQSTFKNIPSSQRSSTDWLGYDNAREIDHSKFLFVHTPNYNEPPGYYEFEALGLAQYFNSMGVNANNFSANSTNYVLLGYEQLGLIGATQFNDPNAVAKARETYENDYRITATVKMNETAVKRQNELLPDNWLPQKYKAPMNFSQNFSIGNQTTLFGKRVGYLLGLRYNKSIVYDPNSVGYRYNGDGAYNDTIQQPISKETNGWSALLNLAVQLNPYHSISFLFMPNVIGVNKVRDGQYIIQDGANSEIGKLADIYYETRKQFVYQLKTEHYFPGLQAKIVWETSYTTGNSNIPDFKTFHSKYATAVASENRYFRYLDENLIDSRISVEMPLFTIGKENPAKIKMGAGYQYGERRFNQYHYMYMFPQSSLGDSQPRIVDSLVNYFYVQNISFTANPTDLANHTFGSTDNRSGFIMVDLPVLSILRFSGGLRVEQTNMFSDADKFHSKNVAEDDERRIVNGKWVLPCKIDNINYLPSINIMVKIRRKQESPVNFRLNYSQTIARPSLREISDISLFDYELRENTTGNPKLKVVHINNYDARLEAFFPNDDNLSISIFYKEFKNHIEFINYQGGSEGKGYRWDNSPYKGWVKGIEIEGRKSIFRQLEVRGNITLTDSYSKISTSIISETGDVQKGRDVEYTMFGQAPYVVNGMLGYTSEKHGINAALSYNLQGPRLISISTYEWNPDLSEMSRSFWDFRASKTIGKHLGVSLKVQDIFNSTIRRAYKFRGTETADGRTGYLLDYDRYNWGTNYTFSVSYRL
jgi:hypothetical protein